MSSNGSESGFVIDQPDNKFGGDVEGMIHVPPGQGHDDFDLKAQIKAMSDAAARRRQRADGGLTLDILDDELGLIGTTGIENQTDRLIREAEELISEGKYEEALEKLDEVLSGAPDNEIALLLKGECLSRFENSALEALRVIKPLHESELKPRLRRRLSRLLADLREKLIPEMFDDFNRVLEESGPAAAAQHMCQYTEVEPTSEDAYFLAGSGWMFCSQYDAAQVQVTGGKAAREGHECARLESLEIEIRRRRVLDVMNEALLRLKSGAIDQALARLRECEAEAKGMELHADFSQFVQNVRQAGGIKGNLFPRNLSQERRRALEFFVTGPELTDALECFRQNEFGKVEQVLNRAVKYAPRSEQVHFLLALSMFLGLAKPAPGAPLQSLNDVEAKLRAAARHAGKAVADKEIPLAAELKKAIDANLEEVRKANKLEKAMRPYKHLFDRFAKTMNDVKASGGFTSQWEVYTFKEKLRKLEAEVRLAINKAPPAAKPHLRKLLSTIEEILAQIPF